MMNLSEEKTVLEKGLTSLERRDGEIQTIKRRLMACLEQNNMLRAEEVALELNNAYEAQTQISRGLPVCIRRPEKIKEPETLMPESKQAKVGFTKEGWFCVLIPALLPKKEKGSPNYIRNILYPAMIRFFRDKDAVRYTNCTLAFRHIYDKKRPARQYRDHDNIELNMVTDIIAQYLLHDDSPLLCEHYYCSAAGEQDETQIFVVPQVEFLKWMVDVKMSEKKEIFLFEKLQK